MRVLYMSHRYHTNQNEIMRGWKEHGDEVLFLTQYQGRIEDYTWIRPVTVGYSSLFNRFYDLYVNHIRKNDPFAKDIRLKYGIPPLDRMEKLIRDFDPDLVILRERSLYTIFTYRICKKYGYKTILYNLSPVYTLPGYYSNDLAHKIVRKLTPPFRLTPTHQIGIDMTGKVRDGDSYFAPFLVEPKCAPANKTYFRDGKINIFEIGKYQDRKNHFLMVDVFLRLMQKYPNLQMTIAGEISDRFHEEYYSRLDQYIRENGAADKIHLKKNLTKKEVGEEYLAADLYVVPSTGEPASITVIESMAYSVPSISGTDNGTADYIQPGVTGEVFKDCDADDLFVKMDSILQDAEHTIPAMGKAAYQSVLDRFQFKNYYDVLCEMMRDMDAKQLKK